MNSSDISFLMSLLQLLGLGLAFYYFQRRDLPQAVSQIKHNSADARRLVQEAQLADAQTDDMRAKTYNDMFVQLMDRDIQLASISKQLVQVQTDQAKLEAKLTVTQEELSDTRKQLNETKQELTQARQELAETQKELNEERKLRLTLQKERDDLRRDVDYLKSKEHEREKTDGSTQ